MRRRTRTLAKFALTAAAIALLVVSLNFSARVAAQNTRSLPAEWSNWKYFRAIDLPATETARLVRLNVPSNLFAHSEVELDDLRIIDDRGREAPYVLRAEYGSTRKDSLAARSLELSYVPEKYTQAVFDVGRQAPFHNSLLIHTPLTNFIAWAQLEISDDARAWRRTGGLQPVYCFASRGVSGAETLNYPETNARYMRLRIYDHAEKFPLESIDVMHTVREAESHVSFRAIPVELTGPTHDTILRADFGYALPIDSVRIESSTAEFYRAVEVYSTNSAAAGDMANRPTPEEDWAFTGAGEVYRFPAAPPSGAIEFGTPRNQGQKFYTGKRVSFPEHAARFWQIRIRNGNDAPLADVTVELNMAARDVVFRQEPGRAYSLLYGQSRIAEPPRYDLGEVLSATAMRGAQPVSGIGAEETNSSWTDPAPWTEKHAAVLWIAVILAVVALAFIAIQSLKGAGRSDSKASPSDG